ncbi:MAG: tetraacyldisaccharide 4'-kinase [Burkholderiaceae bacterium]|nr:tetraacyldisaccharide 4'-kinase [Burkholderiaceae bacterium]
MELRAPLEAWLLRAWQQRGLFARLLTPLAATHKLWWHFDRWRYRVGFAHAQRLPAPVVVVGNLTVGGTGKTPLVIEIVRALRARGWSPGIISRGYRARRREPRLVAGDGKAADDGDEPLLLARATEAPVAVGVDRLAAAHLLLRSHPATNVIVADDGLQHRQLARDVEIALVDEFGFGNGWMLPAGPLREPPQRLADVDAVVLRGQPAVRISSPFFRLKTQLDDAYALADPSQRIRLADLAAKQAQQGIRLLAAAGIGHPQRFFSMLREQGLAFEALALGDHYDFQRNPFAGRSFDYALVTEKDAVKCTALDGLASDARIYVVPLRTRIDAALFDLIEQRLRTTPN